MVSQKPEPLVHSIKLSSVGPGQITGSNIVHEPTNLDLAMKLHYLRFVYYFTSLDLTTPALKEATFRWLSKFPFTCGRFRRTGSGRAHIKCNDCGVRFVEAECGKTVKEWVEMLKMDGETHKLLVPDNVIGPEMVFSPLIYIQLTRFKCEGVSLGLSWAHVLGDAFSASDFMNALGQAMVGYDLGRPIKQNHNHTEPKSFPDPLMASESPLSVKSLGSVGDHWINTHNRKMEVFTIELKRWNWNDTIPPFEFICGLIWKVVAKVRKGNEPKVVTICKKDRISMKNSTLGNHQVISAVAANFSVLEASSKQLSQLMTNEAIDERKFIDEAVEKEKGLSDFVTYGANLTFMDLQDADFYGFELRGKKPVYVSYMIDGVGEEGVVLVSLGPKNDSEDGDTAMIVTLIMPEDEVWQLKSELKREFSFA